MCQYIYNRRNQGKQAKKKKKYNIRKEEEYVIQMKKLIIIVIIMINFLRRILLATEKKRVGLQALLILNNIKQADYPYSVLESSFFVQKKC